jgi:hypothetical protein
VPCAAFNLQYFQEGSNVRWVVIEPACEGLLALQGIGIRLFRIEIGIQKTY